MIGGSFVERFQHYATHMSTKNIGPTCTGRQGVLHRLVREYNAHNMEKLSSGQSPVALVVQFKSAYTK